jgi:indole-3-glycerol phosphate synthase
MASILERIAAYKRAEIAAAKAARPLAEVEKAARAAGPVRPFRAALKARIEGGRPALIAEIKKASPSRGLIRADFDPAFLARAYEQGGASCLSVLTDGPSFQGATAHLAEARAATALPALRKDFMLEPYQVAESRALGADCILIIMAMVDDGAARELKAAAADWGMDALVEVHGERELERAAALGAGFIGINNRELHTFVTTLEVTEHLAPLAPASALLVAESGIAAPFDIARIARVGVRAFLVGESLMRKGDVAAGVRALLAPAEAGRPVASSA